MFSETLNGRVVVDCVLHDDVVGYWGISGVLQSTDDPQAQDGSTQTMNVCLLIV